jgi:hypothetical protein
MGWKVGSSHSIFSKYNATNTPKMGNKTSKSNETSEQKSQKNSSKKTLYRLENGLQGLSTETLCLHYYRLNDLAALLDKIDLKEVDLQKVKCLKVGFNEFNQIGNLKALDSNTQKWLQNIET